MECFVELGTTIFGGKAVHIRVTSLHIFLDFDLDVNSLGPKNTLDQ